MVVERGFTSVLKDQEGQSIVELLLLLPLLIGLTVMLIKVNTTIQVSIVNQKYSRAQLLALTRNSANYPRLETLSQSFIPNGDNRMVLGVSEERIPDEAENFQPDAPTNSIARNSRVRGDEKPQAEPNQRVTIRVRNTVEICTQVNTQRIGGQEQPLTAAVLREGSIERFAYCRRGYDE